MVRVMMVLPCLLHVVWKMYPFVNTFTSATPGEKRTISEALQHANLRAGARGERDDARRVWRRRQGSKQWRGEAGFFGGGCSSGGDASRRRGARGRDGGRNGSADYRQDRRGEDDRR